MFRAYLHSARWAIVTMLLCCVAIPMHLLAQSTALPGSLRNSENLVFLRAEPANPAPNQRVKVSADSPLVDIASANTIWRVNGKEVARGRGIKAIDAQIENSSTIIEVEVTDSTWGTVSQTISFFPLQIDLLYDGPTYVPAFYRGRALPSTGSGARFEAITRFPYKEGYLPNSEITFTWSKNGRVIGSVSGVGKSSAIIDAPSLFSTDVVSVTATAQDGILTAEAQVTIPAREPLLALYADHPLNGIMYHRAISRQDVVSDNEMTFAVVPYFALARSPEDSNLKYQWGVNGSNVAGSSTVKSELTIRAGASGKAAALSVDLSHKQNFFTTAKGVWEITFGGVGSGGGTDSNGDAFHGSI